MVDVNITTDCAVLYDFLTLSTDAAQLLGWNDTNFMNSSRWCCSKDVYPVIQCASSTDVAWINLYGLGVTGTLPHLIPCSFDTGQPRDRVGPTTAVPFIPFGYKSMFNC